MSRAPEGTFEGWHYDHSFDRPVTERWRATRHGVELGADNLESLKGMIRTKNAELCKPPARRQRPFGTKCIFGGGTTLRFHTQEEYDTYSAAIDDVEMRAYHAQRAKYGIWAGNQDKYVASAELLNQHDGHHMEDRYAAWLAKQSKEPT